ncbi:MAG: MmcQ/YjbR family DNA-binding protein [Clostridiales bacterium]|nr:MmcQ/YjbR family DNA-binding protein [Clostridiales bacterium]
MFEEITERKKPIPEKLISYGFENKGDHFRYITDICNGAFVLMVQISAGGEVGTDLIEKETGEAYILYKTSASGAYVGEIRAAIGQVLHRIVENCYEAAVFKMAQARMVIAFVRDLYGDEPEFLWKKTPDNAIWRRKDNRKWYGAILTVAGKKIGLQTDKRVEIIDLRMDPTEAEMILSRENYYPGWHMNKKSWYTIVLDGSVSDEELKDRIRESYKLAGRK